MMGKMSQKGFTLAEMLITIAVMSLVLALVVSFSVAASGATKIRTAQAGSLREIENLNKLITDWFYSFDTTDFTVNSDLCSTGNEEAEYVFDYLDDKAVKINTRYITIQNKNFSQMMNNGIVPFNYQLVYSVDRRTYEPAVSAIYNGEEIVSETLNYIKDINFMWNEELGLLKCVYTYSDAEKPEEFKNYTLILSKHTEYISN